MIAKRLITTIIIFGCILTTFSIIFNMAIPELHKQTINGNTLYVYDFKTYLQNLTINLSNFSELSIELVELDFTGVIEALESIVNVLALGFNILIWPIRLFAYIVRIMLSLFGIYTAIQTSNLSFIYDIVQWLIHMQVPYIQ